MKRIDVEVEEEYKKIIQMHVLHHGYNSLRTFVLEAIKEKIERDKEDIE